MSSLISSPTRDCYTGEDLERLSAQGYRYELIRGELIEMSPISLIHGHATNRFAFFVENYLEEHPVGEGFVGEPGFYLARNPDVVLAPDYAYIPHERLPDPLPPRGFSSVLPDLVLETRSPGDTKREIALKIQQWLSAGVRMALVLDPEAKTLTVHRVDRERLVLGLEDTFDGADILPGFSLSVRKLFRESKKKEEQGAE